MQTLKLNGYLKWIFTLEIGEIIHKDVFYMARQWLRNLRYQIYFIKFQQRENA